MPFLVRSFCMIVITLSWFFAPISHAEECPKGIHETEVVQHCKIFDEPVFSSEKKFQETKERCLCFFREAFRTVEIVKNYEMKANKFAEEFSGISQQEGIGEANSSQAAISDFSRRTQNHHGGLAKSLEVQYILLESKFRSFFSSVNRLNQVGQNNVPAEITCRSAPASPVPALWSVSVAKKTLDDLQRIYLGRGSSKGMRSDIRKLHSEAKTAEKDSAQMKAVTSARSFGVGEVKDNDPEEILHDPTNTVAPHYETRGANLAAGLATSAVAQGSKVLPGVAGLAAAGLTEYLVYHQIDTETLLTIGMGTVSTVAMGSVPGIIIGGSIAAAHTAGRNSAIQKHDYSEFSKREILSDRNITASNLSAKWAKSKNLTCSTILK